ncbi:hypothetical protein EV2_028024 [Malus domestica]
MVVVKVKLRRAEEWSYRVGVDHEQQHKPQSHDDDDEEEQTELAWEHDRETSPRVERRVRLWKCGEIEKVRETDL